MRIAISGFGRIGRLVFRAVVEQKDIEVVAINDLTDTKTLAFLLQHDSVHGEFPGDVSYDDDHIIVNGKSIKVYAQPDPEKLPWKDENVEIAIECTGRFRTKEGAAKHITAGAKKVIISAPSKGDVDFTVVKGVNEHHYDKDNHHIISNASCTTNCLAPIVKVMHDNFVVQRGYMLTIHSFTADQKLVDAPHKDLRRARSAAINIVPTTTGAAKAVTSVIPELKGNLDGMAVRVPTPDGSLVEFVCELEKEPTVEEVNALFKSVSENELKGIIEYLDFPAVSSDIVGRKASASFDPEFTKVEGNLVQILAWYDNECGYSHRIVDIIRLL